MEPIESPLRSVLVVLDGADGAVRAVERAALLPLAPDARLTLLHVIPSLRPARTRSRLQREARATLVAAGRTLERRLPPGASVSSTMAVGLACTQIVDQARAVAADLVVMNRAGSMAGRVIRAVRRPVLVVRSAVHAYRRPMLALDLDETALPLLSFAPRFFGSLCPPLALVHAYETALESVLYPTPSAEDLASYRDHQHHRAAAWITKLVTTGWWRARAWTQHILRGHPRGVIESSAASLACDLIALGTHGRSGLAHACLGSVALDVMRDACCDVLVVPANAAAAARR